MRPSSSAPRWRVDYHMFSPRSYGRDEFSPAEELRAEREQAERDELEDREEEIHEPTEDER